MTRRRVRRVAAVVLLLGLVAGEGVLLAPAAAAQEARADSELLQDLVRRALSVEIPTRSPEQYRAASQEYRQVLADLDRVEYDRLGLDDQVDYDLLEAHVRTEIFEIDTVRLHTVYPVSYYELGKTNRLFVRPGAIPDAGVRSALRELRQLPEVLRNARENLTNPARVWTENAIYQAYYAKMLLEDYVPRATVEDPALKRRLVAAADTAVRAVRSYESWLEEELLPRSDRSPTWDPRYIEFYQFVHEGLRDYGVDEMIRVAEREEERVRGAMEALADSIHPSGDLRTVWENMKEEAPPWDGVLPMADRYVEMASEWLRGEGSHVVTVPDFVDYGARITPPMARRSLSFGGATSGPTLAGRQSGYYILTPLENRLSEEDRRSRLKSYNPYWTHVISFHEWLGHNVQRAAARVHVDRPMRRAYGSIYFSQAWSFYLERHLERQGYYRDVLSYPARLKTRMARLQMRMWRIQRILTKLKMAKGEMSFDEAVRAYVEDIGMEPTNAFIEVQRDSQTPSPPGREIIGERVIIDLREEYRRRMGDHYSLKEFNDELLTYGDLPFPQIRRLMFRNHPDEW